MSSIFYFGLALGVVVGGLIEFYRNRGLKAKRKALLAQKRVVRQRRLLERFRIEVKNNTIRIKKEEKRLALSKVVAPIELIFKNYHKRISKISDKDIYALVVDFYDELIKYNAVNELIMKYKSKHGEGDEAASDGDAVMQFFASHMLSWLASIRESGTNVVATLESKIQKS